jgi:hypothetical protein
MVVAYQPKWGRKPIGKKDNKRWLPYKNEFEYLIGQDLDGADYEAKDRVVPYHIDAKYNVDFTFKDKPWLLIEAKGRFHDGQKEARKYIWVKKCNPTYEIVFIFTNVNNKAYTGVKRRKDGSYLTMGEWAAKNNFLSFSHKHLPDYIKDGTINRRTFRNELNKQRESYGMKPLSAWSPLWGDN